MRAYASHNPVKILSVRGTGTSWFRRYVWAVALLATPFAQSRLGAQHVLQGGNAQATEYGVKAAYLLNFTKFIDWPSVPADSTTPFSICVLGSDPFGPILDETVQGETVNGRKLVVERVGQTIPKNCSIVYVSRSEKGVSELTASLGPGVLTVGEGEKFLREGGMVAFVIDNRRVRFAVNLSAARNHLLTLSSRLLAVAKSVER